MLRQYFNCNERLGILLTCFCNILCYVGHNYIKQNFNFTNSIVIQIPFVYCQTKRAAIVFIVFKFQMNIRYLLYWSYWKYFSTNYRKISQFSVLFPNACFHITYIAISIWEKIPRTDFREFRFEIRWRVISLRQALYAASHEYL